MKQNQIILIFIAIVLSIGLFMLPKAVINKSDKNALQKPKNEDVSEEMPTVLNTDHNKEKTEINNPSIVRLRKKYIQFSNSEKRLIFADSLAEEFEKLFYFDSSLYYRNIIYTELKSKETTLKLAETYQKAFSFAPGDKKSTVYNDKARKYYEDVLAVAPQDLETKSKLAMTFVSTSTPMKGILMLKEVLEINPKQELAIFNLGLLALQSGQFDKAIGRFDNLIKINPKNWEAIFYKGVALKELGKIKECIECMTKVKLNATDKFLTANANGYLEELLKQ